MLTKAVMIKLIIYYSIIYGVNPNVALSVAKVESNFNPNAISNTHDYGIYQLNINSFPNYTEKALLNPRINIELGVKYLKKMQQECKYKNNQEWLTCWNAGKKYTNDHIKHPSKYPYVIKINRMLASYEGENYETH